MYNTLGFTDKVSRDAEWTKLRAEGTRGCVRYTTHDQNHPQIVYVLAYPTVSNLPQSDVPLKIGTEVPLLDPGTLAMMSEGGNTDESKDAVSVGSGQVEAELDPPEGSPQA